MIEVNLDSSQIYQAATVGIIRQTRNLKDKRRPRYEAGNQSDWQLHIEGCLSEFAVAKHLNIYWDGNIGSLSAADVGGLEVRSTKYKTGRLIIHPEDKDESKYILVTGINGVYSIHGWMFGKDGKNPKYWDDPSKGRAAYFIPQEDLHSMASIQNSPL